MPKGWSVIEMVQQAQDVAGGELGGQAHEQAPRRACAWKRQAKTGGEEEGSTHETEYIVR